MRKNKSTNTKKHEFWFFTSYLLFIKICEPIHPTATKTTATYRYVFLLCWWYWCCAELSWVYRYFFCVVSLTKYHHVYNAQYLPLVIGLFIHLNVCWGLDRFEPSLFMNLSFFLLRIFYDFFVFVFCFYILNVLLTPTDCKWFSWKKDEFICVAINFILFNIHITNVYSILVCFCIFFLFIFVFPVYFSMEIETY